jgi:hypothetical protein
VFSPLAWLKLQFFLHAGETEVGGFGVSAPGAADNLLYVDDFVTVSQDATVASVIFDDQAVANYFEDCFDKGIQPARSGRIWCHTHPGDSASPSSTDEDCFSRAFGSCDWAVMFIISRTGQTYARLFFKAGPGASMLLPVAVDWAAWPALACAPDLHLDALVQAWADEYLANIHGEAWGYAGTAAGDGRDEMMGLDEGDGLDTLLDPPREPWEVDDDDVDPNLQRAAHAAMTRTSRHVIKGQRDAFGDEEVRA